MALDRLHPPALPEAIAAIPLNLAPLLLLVEVEVDQITLLLAVLTEVLVAVRLAKPLLQEVMEIHQ